LKARGFDRFRVQGRFAAFKAPAARSRRLRRVQSRFAAFKVQGRFAAFEALLVRLRPQSGVQGACGAFKKTAGRC
jgi:hypothetical protein